jgi:hypothetical protein
MIALLLQAATNAARAAQQAAQNAPAIVQQAPPQVYVTVQQPSGGMPEWIKILISAAVGAGVGIFSNMVTEYIKSIKAKSQALKNLNSQLIPELKENLDQVETVRRMTGRASEGGLDHRQSALGFARDILRSVTNDRYLSNFEEQKALVYEVDPKKTLSGFYRSVANALDAPNNFDFGSLLHYIRIASEQGRGYLSEHGVEYTPTPDSFYDSLVQPPKMEDNPESWFHEITKTGTFAPKSPPLPGTSSHL